MEAMSTKKVRLIILDATITRKVWAANHAAQYYQRRILLSLLFANIKIVAKRDQSFRAKSDVLTQYYQYLTEKISAYTSLL